MADTKVARSYELNEVSPISPATPATTLPLDFKAQRTVLTPPAQNTAPEIQEDGSNDNITKSRSRFRLTMIIVALFLSLFIAALDATIVSTAVPTITADLHSPSGYAWIGGAYLIANAAGAPIWAKLSDMYLSRS